VQPPALFYEANLGGVFMAEGTKLLTLRNLRFARAQIVRAIPPDDIAQRNDKLMQEFKATMPACARNALRTVSAAS
jgi:hypothetical protein